MNDRSLFPESVRIGCNYSFRADVKLNAWIFVATAMALGSRLALHRHVEWSAPLRAVVSLSPLVPSLLYVRTTAVWIRGMDELQRRIQLEACLFATIGTVFVATGFNLLAMAGVLQASRLQNGLGWEGMFATVIAFQILGNLIINRRYR